MTAAIISRNEGAEEVSLSWKAFALSCESTIHELLDAYMDIIYPLSVAPMYLPNVMTYTAQLSTLHQRKPEGTLEDPRLSYRSR